MNYTSMQMQDTLRRLEATLTVEQMREHGYDLTEEDGGLIEKIAEKVEVDADMLWSAVEIWAATYNVRRNDDS